jgi:hypothetical protein
MLLLVTIYIIIYLFITGLIPQVKTNPQQPWYFNTLDWTFRPFMKLTMNGLLTHGWHWRKTRIPDKYWQNNNKTCAVLGDPNAINCLPGNIISQIKAHFLWKKCVVLAPINNARIWQLVFSTYV